MLWIFESALWFLFLFLFLFLQQPKERGPPGDPRQSLL